MKEVIIFTLCVFFSQIICSQSFADCSGAIELSDKSTYVLDQLYGSGNLNQEVKSTSCTKKYFKENNSAWFKWSISRSGNLSFMITPLESNDDLDFIVFKISDIGDCSSREEIRCMASGEQLYTSSTTINNCKGTTGLKTSSLDISEIEGCGLDDDNFLSSLDVKEGEHYLLFINNFSSSKGFQLDFDGTAEFGVKEQNVRIELFPNPANSETELVVTANDFQDTKLWVYNALGKTVYEKLVTVSKGRQSIILDLESIPTGNYTVSLKVDKTILSKKLIVQ